MENNSTVKDITNDLEPTEEVKLTLTQIQSLLTNAKQLLDFQESMWDQVKGEFEVTSNQMKPIIDYNELNMVIPDGVDLNDANTFPEDFDFFNGLDNISEDKLIEIFGDGSKIFGVEYSQTIDRVKWAAQAFKNYISTMFEFNNISREYSNLIEEQEQINVQAMKDAIDKLSDDDEQRLVIQSKLDDYFYFKELQFLGEVVNNKDRNYIANTFSDGRKIQYLLDRTRSILNRIGVSEKFILEIASFEKLYLDEKYHSQNNLLLIYFMNLLIFNDMDAKDGIVKRKILSMVVNIDKYIRKHASNAEILLSNIIKLEDQFLDIVHSSEDKIN